MSLSHVNAIKTAEKRSRTDGRLRYVVCTGTRPRITLRRPQDIDVWCVNGSNTLYSWYGGASSGQELGRVFPPQQSDGGK